MAWRALEDMRGPVRRTWLRRCAAGGVRSYVDPRTAKTMVWVGWPSWRASRRVSEGARP